MSVQNQIDRITQNVASTYEVLGALGCEMPEQQTSDNLARTAGSFTLEQELTEQDALISQIQTALHGKTSGSVPGEKEEWVFTLENGSTVTKEVYVD